MDQQLVDRHAQELYGLGRDEFTAERDRVARELKADGHPDAAAAVKRLRKPTVPAWAVNQLARRHPEDVAALAAAGMELRHAQQQAASGGGAEAMRTATRTVRDLVGALRADARGVLEEAGASPEAHLEDVSRTLFAAAADPAHRATLEAGTFDRPLEASGFGAFDLSTAPAVRTRKKATKATAGGRRKLGSAGAGRKTTAKKTAAGKAGRGATATGREATAADAERQRELRTRRARLQRELQRQQQRVERAEAKAADLRARADDADADAEQQRAELARLELELAALD